MPTGRVKSPAIELQAGGAGVADALPALGLGGAVQVVRQHMADLLRLLFRPPALVQRLVELFQKLLGHLRSVVTE
ncbi:MAG TPA: hypothetical protein VK689_20330 [Armatimonadota bacterium]|nr:hypothetical protein [Armatimonadota bacterium]